MFFADTDSSKDGDGSQGEEAYIAVHAKRDMLLCEVDGTVYCCRFSFQSMFVFAQVSLPGKLHGLGFERNWGMFVALVGAGGHLHSISVSQDNTIRHGAIVDTAICRVESSVRSALEGSRRGERGGANELFGKVKEGTDTRADAQRSTSPSYRGLVSPRGTAPITATSLHIHEELPIFTVRYTQASRSSSPAPLGEKKEIAHKRVDEQHGSSRLEGALPILGQHYRPRRWMSPSALPSETASLQSTALHSHGVASVPVSFTLPIRWGLFSKEDPVFSFHSSICYMDEMRLNIYDMTSNSTYTYSHFPDHHFGFPVMSTHLYQNKYNGEVVVYVEGVVPVDSSLRLLSALSSIQQEGGDQLRGGGESLGRPKQATHRTSESSLTPVMAQKGGRPLQTLSESHLSSSGGHNDIDDMNVALFTPSPMHGGRMRKLHSRKSHMIAAEDIRRMIEVEADSSSSASSASSSCSPSPQISHPDLKGLPSLGSISAKGKMLMPLPPPACVDRGGSLTARETTRKMPSLAATAASMINTSTPDLVEGLALSDPQRSSSAPIHGLYCSANIYYPAVY